MNKSTIQTLIDKVIGKKGIIRVPSWWMRKVLMHMADWVQEGDDANNEKIVKVSEDAEKLRNLTLPYTLVSGTGEVNIDGNKVSFTDADKQLIYITGAVKFKKGDGSYNDFITYIHIPHIDIRSQGRDMSSMFDSCSGLTSLDLSGFDTSAVTIMLSMFYDCSSLTSLILGPNFFKAPNVTSIDFSYCSKWTNNTVVTSLVTNSYDRATAGLKTMTLKLSTNTKAALTDEQKAAITAKGYTIA